MFDHEQLHSTQGHRLTRALFKETCRPADTPIMTLSRNPKEGLVQLAPLFVELVTDDPSEYVFAETVFGTYAHWKLIADAAWMEPYLEEWRLECDVRRKSAAFRGLYKDVLEGGRSATTSAKYLIEENWKDKRKPKVKEAAEKSTAKASETVSEDFLRLREHLK